VMPAAPLRLRSTFNTRLFVMKAQLASRVDGLLKDLSASVRQRAGCAPCCVLPVTRLTVGPPHSPHSPPSPPPQHAPLALFRLVHLPPVQWASVQSSASARRRQQRARSAALRQRATSAPVRCPSRPSRQARRRRVRTARLRASRISRAPCSWRASPALPRRAASPLAPPPPLTRRLRTRRQPASFIEKLYEYVPLMLGARIGAPCR